MPSPRLNIIIQFDKLRHNFFKFSSFATAIVINISHLRPPNETRNICYECLWSELYQCCNNCVNYVLNFFLSISLSLYFLPACLLFLLPFHISCTNLIEYTKTNVENDYYYCVALWLKVFQMRFDGRSVVVVVVRQSKYSNQPSLHFENFSS